MRKELLTAIIYCNQQQPNGNHFLKYRNISNTDTAKSKFLLFARKFVGAEYVNWYDKYSREFIERIYLQ